MSGKKYLGGSQGVSKKAGSLKDIEDHGEHMVKVSKKKPTKLTTSASSASKVEARVESPRPQER